MKFKFIEGEGYWIIISEYDTRFDRCANCLKEINDEEVFYVCEKYRTAYCDECRLKTPCQNLQVTIIPKPLQIRELCVHRKVLGKRRK